ncbi:MAG: ThiF family adenylyltransferase [Candidatus Pacearchaeota archaeon]
MRNERLDRQLRIEGWNQEALENKLVGIIGDNKFLTSFYVLSAAALGINKQAVIAPSLNERIIKIASSINPYLELGHIRGYYVHPHMRVFLNTKYIIDLTGYNLAKKLLIEDAFMNDLNVLLTNFSDGVKIFNYSRGKEYKELEEILTEHELPIERKIDPITAIIGAGIALEETKNMLMDKKVSDELIKYSTSNKEKKKHYSRIKALIIGAGALGNIVGIGLALIGLKKIDIIDPDNIEETNLNRQIMFYEAVGEEKAKTLAKRLNELFNTHARGIRGYFREDFNIKPYDVIFDCVDNFETRIVISEKCKKEGKLLISGGTSYKAGQVVVYNPKISEKTPAEFLGLYEIVDRRKIAEYQRVRASCSYQPNPSVIMSNEIIGGIMVDKFRAAIEGNNIEPVFYDAESEKKLG